MELISSILAIIMAIIVLVDRFSSRVTPVQLERRIAEVYRNIAKNYPSKTSFDDVKEKIDKIYDIIIKRIELK